MARVLFNWESGGGLGHLFQMLALAEALVKKGHIVYVALRHLSSSAAEVFGRAGVRFRQAPFKSTGPRPFARTPGFAHLLANTGWGDARELFALAYAWRGLMEDVRPDLNVFDRAATALLASRALPSGVKRVVIGSGFCCPPDTFPLPALAAGADPLRLAEDEQRVLRRANRVLAEWRLPPLQRLGQLYSEVDETFLMTFEELEQFPTRRGATYRGAVLPDGSGTGDCPRVGGEAPRWPAGGGKRVLAYLRDRNGDVSNFAILDTSPFLAPEAVARLAG